MNAFSKRFQTRHGPVLAIWSQQKLRARARSRSCECCFAAHGIGLIKLDADNPAESQVLIPARERDEIDWDMANRLATENRDFLDYVKLVKQFYQTGEARLADWDVPETTD